MYIHNINAFINISISTNVSRIQSTRKLQGWLLNVCSHMMAGFFPSVLWTFAKSGSDSVQSPLVYSTINSYICCQLFQEKDTKVEQGLSCITLLSFFPVLCSKPEKRQGNIQCITFDLCVIF